MGPQGVSEPREETSSLGDEKLDPDKGLRRGAGEHSASVTLDTPTQILW